jgi:hypothetical protein
VTTHTLFCICFDIAACPSSLFRGGEPNTPAATERKAEAFRRRTSAEL